MNVISFIDLIREIFYKKKPDIEKIQKKGLLAVKIAQTFALRIDFLDEHKCYELSKLFNHVEKIPSESIDKLIEKYMGQHWLERNFQSFNKESFASASIGQVHEGVLRSGERVAVKIIKHNFKQRFEKDVQSVLQLFKWIIRFYPKLAKVADPVGILNSIRAFTLDELDLRNELRNRNLLFEIWEQNRNRVDLSRLKFINIKPELTGENIMVSEYIEGETFDKLLAEKKMPYDILLELFHIHGFYIFGIGIFHGDIHPGNIILQGQDICFVDCGAIGRVGERLRKGLFHFMESLSMYEFRQCAYWLNQMSEVTLEGNSYKAYEEKLLKLYEDFENATVSQVSLTKRMMETIKLGVNSGMSFEQGMFPIIKSLMYMDGMVLRCNPQAVLMKDMRRYIEEFKRFV
ncbi:MAG: AarF/ABC1/UbiB kinase family protein [Clostridia bacterium]|nr:AarF/ABC1/UbiB kinase family protein [Clostridia bacterium]